VYIYVSVYVYVCGWVGQSVRRWLGEWVGG